MKGLLHVEQTAVQAPPVSCGDHPMCGSEYLRYPRVYQDVTNLIAKRGLDVDRSTVFRGVQKFGPQLSRRAPRRLSRASLNWHVDETCIRVGEKWRYLWRAIDANGQLVDFRHTARRDAKAA
jgi:IS6 family transposase